MGKKIEGTLLQIMTGIFAFIFMVALLGVLFGGNRVDYYEICKTVFLADNLVLFAMGSVALLAWLAIGYLFRNQELNKKQNRVVNIVLVLLFVGLYFINREISYCIAFFTGWDVSGVSGSAYNLAAGVPIGYNYYYSMYTNNVPMVYFLYKLYDLGIHRMGLEYQADILWIAVNNIGLSIGGFAACMTVKRVTGRLMPVLTTLLFYIGCVCFTPWKVIPYTDMYALMFTILTICFYVYAITAREHKVHYLYWLLTCLCGFMGGLIKPSAYVVVMAVIIMEVLHILFRSIKAWKSHLVKLLMVLCVVGIMSAYKGHMYEATGFEYNPVIRATPHHYFLMGLNEPTTGGYYSDDVALIGRYDDFDERIEAEMELAWGRLKEKGFLGYMEFLFKKLVMCFNDGTFGWGKEGGFYFQDYHNMTDAPYKQFLRDIFWMDARYSGRFNTYSQLIWIMIMVSISGLFLTKCKEEQYAHKTIMLTLLGVILYLLLFEARARYLLCFLPVLVVAAVLGLEQYARMCYALVDKKKEKNRDEAEE